MMLKKMFAGVFGRGQTVNDGNSWVLRHIGGRTKTGIHVTEHTALTFPAVYACVGIISDCIAQLPLRLMKKTSDGAEIHDDHPLAEALHLRPNPQMNAFTLLQTTESNALLWGNAYIEIERNGRGQAVGLYPLLPDRTRPVKESAEAELRYETSISGKTYRLHAEDVCHIKALGFSGLQGISQIALHRQAVGLGLAMEEFGAKFFANDAKSGGFLQHPGKLSAPAAENIKKSIEEQGGLDNAHRVKLLEEGMKFVPTTIPPEDAQFLSSREFQVAEIARMYRVPGPLVGSMEKTSSWGTGIEQLMIGFVQFTLQPWITQWEKELTIKALTAKERAEGLYVKFNTNALLRGDIATRSTFYKNGINDGWMTRNEVRAKEDMNALPGLDEPLVPLNMAAAGSEPDEPEEDAADPAALIESDDI